MVRIKPNIIFDHLRLGGGSAQNLTPSAPTAPKAPQLIKRSRSSARARAGPFFSLASFAARFARRGARPGTAVFLPPMDSRPVDCLLNFAIAFSLTYSGTIVMAVIDRIFLKRTIQHSLNLLDPPSRAGSSAPCKVPRTSFRGTPALEPPRLASCGFRLRCLSHFGMECKRNWLSCVEAMFVLTLPC